MSGSMGSAGSMPNPMDRRDFLIRLAIGAAFALAGVPLLGEWLREWAERRQRHDAILRQLRYQAQQAMAHTAQRMAEQLYGSYPAGAFAHDQYIAIHNTRLITNQIGAGDVSRVHLRGNMTVTLHKRRA